MTKGFFIKAIRFLVYVTIIGTPLFYLRRGVYPYSNPKTLFFQAVVEGIFFLWLGLCVLDRRYVPKWSPIIGAFALYLGALLLTGFLGEDPWRSFWSTQERGYGIVTLLHLGAFALVLVSMRAHIPWRRLLLISLGTASVVSVLGIGQLWNTNLLLNEPVGNRPGSTFGNPTFLGGYLMFHIFFAAYFILDYFRVRGKESGSSERSLSTTVFYGVLVALIIIGAAFTNAQTRGDIIGVGLGGIVLATLFAMRPPNLCVALLRSQRTYIFFLIAVFGLGTLFWATSAHEIWDVVPGMSRFRNFSLDDQSLMPRLVALRAAWAGFLEQPYLGWGWDNFNIVFNKYYDPEVLQLSYAETRFDKPHNLYLEYLIVGGVMLAAAFVALVGACFYELWYLKDRLMLQVGTAAFVAYLVRSFFVFDTLGPFLGLVMLFAVIENEYRHEDRDGEVSSHQQPVETLSRRERRRHERAEKITRGNVGGVASCIALVALVPIYVVNIQSLRASNYSYWGFNHFVNGKPGRGIESFKRSFASWSPYNWLLKRDYAITVAEAYFNNPDLVSPEEGALAVNAMEEVAREHSKDAYNHYALVDIYNQVAVSSENTVHPNKDEYLRRAEEAAATALSLSPERQEVYFSLAKTKSLQGDLDGALALAGKALALDPLIPDSHFYYGLLAFAVGDAELGAQEIREALRLGKTLRGANEARYLGNHFADAGHLEEAAAFYQDGLRMAPDDVEIKIKLGIVYFFSGDRERARTLILDAAQLFDLRTSLSYAELAPILDELGIQ